MQHATWRQIQAEKGIEKKTPPHMVNLKRKLESM